MEGSELFRHAENWLNNNPGKNLADYKKATGYSGPNLKTRQRKGEPVRVSYKGRSAAAQTRRASAVKPKTPEEAAALSQVKRQAKSQTQSTLHQFAYEGKPSIAEHDVRIASGGTNEYMSISDPEFKRFKDTIESKLPPGQIADIDDVTGGVRIIPEQYHNKFQPTSQQPGFTLEIGDDIDQKLKPLSLDKGSVRLGGFRRATKLIPLIPAALGAAEAFSQAKAGDLKAAQATAAETVVGEIPVVGDVLTADPVASGTLEGAKQQAVRAQQPKSTVAKIVDDPMNELEYAGKQALKGLKSFAGGIIFGF